jgi:hypothetical protein
MTEQAEHPPHAIASPKLLVPSSACPTKVESLCRPTDKIAPSFVEDAYDITNKASRQATSTPCSPRHELSALLTSGSPANPNNDLMSNKIICQLDLSSKKAREDVQGGEQLDIAVSMPIRSDEETPTERDPDKSEPSNATDAGRHDQDVISVEVTAVARRSHQICPSSFLPTTRPSQPPEIGCQWLEDKPSLPFTKVSEDKEARPDQRAISKTKVKTCSCSPEAIVALAPSTHEPVSQPPAYPCSSPEPELETRLCWKPPDHGGSRGRHVHYVVNERLRLSMITCSQKSLAAILLLITKPVLPQIHPNHLTLIW